MVGLVLLAVLLVFAGSAWLLLAMFRVSVWWGIFGLLFPPVQWLFVFLYWGKAWRPLLLQLLAFGLLVFALLNSPDLEIQEYWEQATQQITSAVPEPAASMPALLPAAAVAPAAREEPALADQAKRLYKCKAADGGISYTDQPCANGSRELDSVAVPAYSAPRPALVERVLSAIDMSPAVAASGFRCDGRTLCSQMNSCEEAKFFLTHCPGVQMDGNADGVPCERQWCGGG